MATYPHPDEDHLSTAEALERFDALAPVPCETMIGWWRGRDLPTGHPLDGLLGAYGWWGKAFEDVETVHPLLFRTGRGLVALDPHSLPVGLALRRPDLVGSRAAVAAFRLLRPLLTTQRPRARLRNIQHRGVLTAAMVYDHLPIVDMFRAVDADTMLGLMDLRGAAPFFFLLRRETS